MPHCAPGGPTRSEKFVPPTRGGRQAITTDQGVFQTGSTNLRIARFVRSPRTTCRCFLLMLFSFPFRDPKQSRFPYRALSHRGSSAMGPRVLELLPAQARIVEQAHGFFASRQQAQPETRVPRRGREGTRGDPARLIGGRSAAGARQEDTRNNQIRTALHGPRSGG